MTSNLSSALEVCIDDDVLYKSTYTLLYFTLGGRITYGVHLGVYFPVMGMHERQADRHIDSTIINAGREQFNKR